MLGVALRTVQLWVESGSLSAWKTLGGHRRIVRASVERLLDQQKRAITESGKRKRFALLIVEDDPRERRMYELEIEKWGLPIDLHLAKDGFEGLLKAGSMKPNCILVDLQLSGINGFRMIEAIRQNVEINAEIAVVTSMTDAQIEDHGGLGADVRVFRKPVPMGGLFDMITAHMQAIS